MLPIAGGFVLLGVCLLLGGVVGATRDSGLPVVALAFLPIWLAAAVANTWLGRRRAGYSVTGEARGFLVVFAVPAAAALLAWWKLS
jgi:hypothetical protein